MQKRAGFKRTQRVPSGRGPVNVSHLAVSAPAKVNWYLHILGKRPDGFHDLETLFVRLDLADRITLIERPQGIRVITSARLPKGPKNLAYRAAALLRQECGISKGVHILLDKKIPAAAGLGGGSSDAASVLLGLNRLWKLGLSLKRLSVLGARLGSDVPFFIRQTPYAIGRGRGEKITPIASKRRLWHVLVRPSFGISTAQAYADYARLALRKPASLTPPRGGAKILVRFLRTRRPDGLPDGFFNSLEVALNKRVMKINRIKAALLENGAAAALLSGSGSTVFGVFENEKKARLAMRRLAAGQYGKVFLAKSI